MNAQPCTCPPGRVQIDPPCPAHPVCRCELWLTGMKWHRTLTPECPIHNAPVAGSAS